MADELFNIIASFQEPSCHVDIDTLWDVFKTKLEALVDTYISSKVITPRKRKSKPWMNEELRTISNKNRHAYVK